jgi:hydroxymethylbilane synthase
MHWPTQWKCLAERACLRRLEGGCSVPVGISSELQIDEDLRGGVLTITGCVTSIDGTRHIEHTLNERVHTTTDAEALGTRLAQMLMQTGADAILEDIKADRAKRAAED